MIILGTSAMAIGRIRWLMEHKKLQIDGRKLRASEVAVLIEMAANTDDDLLTWCPQQKVADRTGLGLAQVQRALKVLTGDEKPLRLDHYRTSGVKVYRLVLPKDDADKTVPAPAAASDVPTSAPVWVPRMKGEIIPLEVRERERLEYEARRASGCAS